MKPVLDAFTGNTLLVAVETPYELDAEIAGGRAGVGAGVGVMKSFESVPWRKRNDEQQEPYTVL